METPHIEKSQYATTTNILLQKAKYVGLANVNGHIFGLFCQNECTSIRWTLHPIWLN